MTQEKLGARRRPGRTKRLGERRRVKKVLTELVCVCVCWVGDVLVRGHALICSCCVTAFIILQQGSHRNPGK